MELSIYSIIVGPVVSSKAYSLQSKHKKITLEVHTAANKPLVAQAMKKMFDVEVDNVRIIVKKGKRRISRKRNVSVDKMRKIAIITLKKGYDVNLLGDVAQTVAAAQASGALGETPQAKEDN